MAGVRSRRRSPKAGTTVLKNFDAKTANNFTRLNDWMKSQLRMLESRTPPGCKHRTCHNADDTSMYEFAGSPWKQVTQQRLTKAAICCERTVTLIYSSRALALHSYEVIVRWSIVRRKLELGLQAQPQTDSLACARQSHNLW